MSKFSLALSAAVAALAISLASYVLFAQVLQLALP